MITNDDLNNWFSWHNLDQTAIDKCTAVRNAALKLAKVIIKNSPSNADQTAAIRKLREVVWTVNGSISCE